MRVGQLLTMFSFVRFPLKDATVIHPWFLFSMSSEVQLRECRRQQLERWPYCLHLSMAKHGKLWLAAWQHLATSGNIWQHGLQHVTILLRWFPKGTAWCSPVPNKAWDLACRHRLGIMERMERMEVEPWSRAGAVTN